MGNSLIKSTGEVVLKSIRRDVLKKYGPNSPEYEYVCSIKFLHTMGNTYIVQNDDYKYS
jgi:hypothetical protein